MSGFAGRAQSPEDFMARLARDHGLEDDLSYPRWLRRSGGGDPDRTALVSGGRRTSYARLFEAVDDVAGWLRHERGLRPGERVAMLVDNCDDYPVWYLGIVAAGLMAVPLNTRLVPREIAFQLADSACRLVVTQTGFLERLAEVEAAGGPKLPLVAVDRDAFPAGARHAGDLPAVGIDDPFCIYYTSGTTGTPKGVMHSHRAMIAHAVQCWEAWEFDRPDMVYLAMAPFFHIAAHAMFLPVLARGGTLVVEGFRTERTFETILAHGVTELFAVPSMLLLMLQSPARPAGNLPGVRTVQFGAAPMAMERLAEVQALFPNASLVHGMGQTECGGSICTLPGRFSVEKIGSIGPPIRGCEARIVDETDAEVPRGTVGELVARGPHVMLGYLNRPEASAETLRGGWLHTGDLGWMDGDGCVFLVDRKKDMIIRGGENIYSTEVEGVIYAHPDVSLCAVVGRKSPVWGEEVVAFVIARPGTALDAAALDAHCRAELAGYKVPVEFRLVDAFPLTATGKIQKGELKALLSS